MNMLATSSPPRTRTTNPPPTIARIQRTASLRFGEGCGGGIGVPEGGAMGGPDVVDILHPLQCFSLKHTCNRREMFLTPLRPRRGEMACAMLLASTRFLLTM